MMRPLLEYILLLVLVAGCNRAVKEEGGNAPIALSEAKQLNFESPIELVAYVNNTENGYLREKEIDNIRFSALYKPLDYIMACENLKDHPAALQVEDLQYIDFRIEVKDFNKEFLKYDLDSPKGYYERVDYCAFKMQNDLKLVDGKDTLPCVLFNFERAYDVVPFGHFQAAFPTENTGLLCNKTLIYYDRLFGKGLVKLTFKPNDLIKVPKLAKV